MGPIVAVLLGRSPAERYSVHRGYVDALWAVGATPVLLSPPPPGRLAPFLAAAARCDAVLVTGGGDVAPTRYGETPATGLMDVDADRDEGEIAVVRDARARGTRVLGICRGAQVLAVALGGSLYQDVSAGGFRGVHWQEERQYEPVHDVVTAPGSLTAAVLGARADVNSIHHQAVRDPGPQLTASAWSDDGLIEAVEGPGLLGLQWHPERLLGSGDEHLAPFRWLTTGRPERPLQTVPHDSHDRQELS